MAYLQKYTTLEHMQADQVAKLQSDIIYRRLLEVSAAAQVNFTWSCWLGAECGVGGWLTVGYTRDHRSDDVLEALCVRSRLNAPKPKPTQSCDTSSASLGGTAGTHITHTA